MAHSENREGVLASGYQPVPPEVEPEEAETAPDQERQELLERIWWLAQRRSTQPGARIAGISGASLTRQGDTDTDINIHYLRRRRGCDLKITVKYSETAGQSTIPGVTVMEDVFEINQHPKKPYTASRTTTSGRDLKRPAEFAEYCKRTGQKTWSKPRVDTVDSLGLSDLEELNRIVMSALPRNPE